MTREQAQEMEAAGWRLGTYVHAEDPDGIYIFLPDADDLRAGVRPGSFQLVLIGDTYGPEALAAFASKKLGKKYVAAETKPLPPGDTATPEEVAEINRRGFLAVMMEIAQ